MPFNGSTYLTQHGWRGKGIPLDGEQGRGLKKPIALPMKRNLKGLGKERDRATEWWDCVFEAGAKKLQSPSSTPSHAEADGSSTAAVAATSSSSTSVSLVALAKRQLAQKMLMNGFVRGRESEYEKRKREAEEAFEQNELARKQGQQRPETGGVEEKLEKARRKEEKKRRRKEEKGTTKTEEREKKKEGKQKKKKRKREEERAEETQKKEGRREKRKRKEAKV